MNPLPSAPLEAPAPANDIDDEPSPARARLLELGPRKTLSAGTVTQAERRAAALVVYPDDVERPRVRRDCEGGPRPCPFVSCKFHLYLDVDPRTGSIKFNFPGIEPWELAESCALDVADRGWQTLEQVGELVGLTRERIRQVEIAAERFMAETPEGRRLAELDLDPQIAALVP